MRTGCMPGWPKPRSLCAVWWPDVARKRLRWKAHPGGVDLQRLVFIYETWVKTNMTPLRGWAARGKRLIGKAPFGHRFEGRPEG